MENRVEGHVHFDQLERSAGTHRLDLRAGLFAEVATGFAVQDDLGHRGVNDGEVRTVGGPPAVPYAVARKRYGPLVRMLFTSFVSVYAYSPGSRSRAPPCGVSSRTTPPFASRISSVRRPIGATATASPRRATAPAVKRTPLPPSTVSGDRSAGGGGPTGSDMGTRAGPRRSVPVRKPAGREA